MRTSLRALAILLALGACGASLAEALDPATIRRGDTGPLTPYGETPAEAAAKAVMFDWVYMNMVERKPREAFERYVSKDYCNHSHLSTGGQVECMGYWPTLERWVRNYGAPLTPGQKIEMPNLASVNGEMVTMYGAGVDIFQVRDGKILAHWDASPPKGVTIKGHAPGFFEWMMGDRKGTPPGYEGPSTTAVTVTEAMLQGLDVGPITPYGETPWEQANKRVMFDFLHAQMILGQPEAAFRRYVSPQYCNHGHLSTLMKRECAGYDEALERAKQRYAKPAAVGDRMEIPTMATVNGEMVTMYGAGVDIFRIQNGLITDHWDGSPPATVTFKDRDPAMIERMKKVVAGELPVGTGPGPGAAAPAPAQSEARP